MSDQINYEAVLADLEAKKSQLDAAIAGVRLAMGLPTGAPNPGGGAPSGGGGGGVAPAHDAFIGMSIPEATKKHLTTVRKKLSTQELITALEAGGLPPIKYSTAYNVLRRRELQIGDIINMKGDWALSEWYPNYRKGKTKEAEPDGGESKEPAKATASKKESKEATA